MTIPITSSSSPDNESQKTSSDIWGPPEESFDEKYNKRLEFPLSLVSAVLLHVVAGALLTVFLVYVLGGGRDLPNVTVSLVKVTGLDDTGLGNPGAGRDNDPFFDENHNPVKPFEELNRLPDPDLQKKFDALVPKENLPRFSETPDKSPEKPQPGGKPGAGGGTGKGDDPSKDKGPGGAGADATQARNLRWVLRFKVTSGKDYLEQLQMLGAEILIPVPNTDKCILIPDANKPNERREATQDDLKRLKDKITFCDSRPEAVKAMARTLALDFTPKEFWAFFPAELEKELARKESSYRNRRAEDIQETIFRVTVRDGKCEIDVDEQTIKR